MEAEVAQVLLGRAQRLARQVGIIVRRHELRLQGRPLPGMAQSCLGFSLHSLQVHLHGLSQQASNQAVMKESWHGIEVSNSELPLPGCTQEPIPGHNLLHSLLPG